MKKINTLLDKSELQNDLNLSIDPNSSYVLIEKGQEVEPGYINIVFAEYDKSQVRELLKKSGYYSKDSNHILGKIDNDLELINLKDVIYFEGINNDTYIHTKNKEYGTKLKLYEIEEMYQNKLFVRISKSYIVSLHHIKKIKPTFNGKLNLDMSNGLKLEVTRHYIKDFRSILGM